jgi:hypothetical protein
MTLTVPGIKRAGEGAASTSKLPKDNDNHNINDAGGNAGSDDEAGSDAESEEAPKPATPEELEKKLLNDEEEPLTKEELDDKIELMKEAAKIEEGFRTWNE